MNLAYYSRAGTYGGFLSTSESFCDFNEIWYERHAIGGSPQMQ
jgi:hypothetical protein